MKKVIEIDKLTKDFMVGFWRPKPKRVLDGLSLEVTEGEVFGFLGANGAGKTTTLKLLMGLIYPTAGSAKILGKSISQVEMRYEIGYLPEAPYFYDYLTAREFLDYCGKLFKIPEDLRKKRIAQLLKLVDMEHAVDTQLRKFSKGMLQRIGIAQALINDPKVVFMDEPMSGLDPIGRREVRDIISSLRDQGKTVFFSTHILSDVEVLCDRVAILRTGKLAGYGKLVDLQQPGSKAMEVIARGLEAKNIEDLRRVTNSVKETASGVNIQIGSEKELGQLIATIHSSGGTIISVNPAKNSLEDFFSREKVAADSQ
ncbi:MAG: ABC transporter ATP-binding protein [Blastocatellia bacterium]|nr:ABC transporter ATP-binding protein [Blastocatellia bacterium]